MEHINLFEQNKKRKIGYILLTILIATVFTLLPLLLSGCDFLDIFSETKGIEVKEEKLITSWEAIIGDNLFPILRVQIKNTSNSTKKGYLQCKLLCRRRFAKQRFINNSYACSRRCNLYICSKQQGIQGVVRS